jgi:hypothetical protein
MTEGKEKLPDRLVATRLPFELADRVQRAAEQQMVSIACYTRQALLARVRVDEQRKV